MQKTNPCYNSTLKINGTLLNESTGLPYEDLEIYINNQQITTIQTDSQGNYEHMVNLKNIPVQDMAKLKIIYNSIHDDIKDGDKVRSFSIEKIKNQIQITNMEENLKNINLTGLVTDENNKMYNGKLIANITDKTNNTVYYNNNIIVTNGIFQVNFKLENGGEYKVKLITPSDEYFMESMKTEQLTLDKTMPTIILEESYDSIIGENVQITGKIINEQQEAISGVHITIRNDIEVMGTTVTDDNGVFNFTEYKFHEIPEDDILVLYFEIEEDDNLQGAYNKSSIILSRRNVHVTLNADEYVIIYGTLHLNGSVEDSINNTVKPDGTITVYINDRLIMDNITVTGGQYNANISINDTFKGLEELRIEAFFIPENQSVYYDQNYAEASIIQDMIVPRIIISAPDMLVDESMNISVRLTDENNNNLNKNITIIIRDEEDNIIINNTGITSNGTFLQPVNITKQGNYHITVCFKGEENIYSPVNEEEEFTVYKKDTLLAVYDLVGTVYVNDTLNIMGKLTDTDNHPLPDKNLLILINEEYFNTTITDPDGRYTIEYKPSLAQQYNMTIIFTEDYKYDDKSVNTIFNPIKHDTRVLIDDITQDNKYNSSITIKGRVTTSDNDIVNGSVDILVNKQLIANIILTGGEYQTTYKTDIIGLNNVSVIFNENRVYYGSSLNTTLNTNRLNTSIVIDHINNTQINKTLTFTIHVKDENNNNVDGKISVKINNKTVQENINLINSSYSFNYRTIQVGQNTIQVFFTPQDNIYNPAGNQSIFNVTRTNLELTNVSKQVNNKDNTITVTGQLINNNEIPTSNITITIQVNDENITTITDENGSFNITTKTLQPGQYNISINMNQTEYFIDYNEDLGNISVDKYTPIIHINPHGNATYSKNYTITGYITDNYDRPLKQQEIIISTQYNQYPTKTDNQGQYNITINNLQTGPNNLEITVPETNYTKHATINTTITTVKDTAKIILEPLGQINAGDTLTIRGQLLNSDNNKLTDKNITIKINNKTVTVKTDNEGIFEYKLQNIQADNYTQEIYFEDYNHIKTSTTRTTKADKIMVNLVVEDIVARVGEYITFHATLKDQYGNNVNGGNLVFKLNGRTLRSDGRFDTNTTSVLKFSVKDGVVEYTLTADLYLRHGKNISASYSGSYRYYSAKSNTATASIQLRYVNINVTTSTSTVKHHENITFTAQVKDVTPNSHRSLLNNDASIIFKINGVSIKDENNKIIRIPVTGDTAVLNYNITTLAGINKTSQLRDYIVTAVYDNPNYYPENNKNNTTFNVERSPVNINITEARINTNQLSLKANLTDYLGYNIVGKSKVCIKINGITYKEYNLTKYYTINDGILDINSIDVEGMKVKRVEIVTGQH